MSNENPEALNLRLLANFIHQVVNPLNGVSGILTNAVEGRIREENFDKRLKQSSAQLNQCIALIKNLAFFAQGFKKLNEQDLADVLVPKMLIDCINFFQEHAANKDVRVELENPQDQYEFHAHPELSKQIFLNLIDNAVKYCDKGTVVKISTHRQNQDKNICVIVESVGSQIEHNDIERIFKVGERGENAKNILASGTGLGLFICKEIVETCHSGQIFCESSKGGVTKFYVKLPSA